MTAFESIGAAGLLAFYAMLDEWHKWFSPHRVLMDFGYAVCRDCGKHWKP